MDDNFLYLDLLDIAPYKEVYIKLYNFISSSEFFSVDILFERDKKTVMNYLTKMNQTINFELLDKNKTYYRKVMRENIKKIEKDRVKRGSLILRDFKDDESIEIKGLSYFKTNNLFFLAYKSLFKEEEKRKIIKLQKKENLPITGRMKDYLIDIAKKYNYYTGDCIYQENINSCLYKAAKEGYYRDVKIIIDEYDYNIYYALKGAAAGGRYYLFITLLDRIEDEYYKFDFSIMEDVFSTKNNSILKLIFINKDKIFEPPLTNVELKNIFINSCKFSKVELVKYIYDNINLNINIDNSDLNYGILNAIEYDNLSVVRYILDDLNLILDNDIEYYMLEKAIVFNSLDTLSFFIQRDLGDNINEINYKNIFINNIEYIEYETITLLIEYDYLKIDDDLFDTIIYPACKIDYIDLVRNIFLDYNLDTFKDETLIAIDIAISYKSYNVFYFLIQQINFLHVLDNIFNKIKGDIKLIKNFIKFIKKHEDLFIEIFFSKLDISSTPEINAYIKSEIIDFIQKLDRIKLINYVDDNYTKKLVDTVLSIRNDIKKDDFRDIGLYQENEDEF